MISNSIQELFDGTLNDEQTAELLHSLSVSPEKRLDFRRHMALQGAMQRDRAASALTSEEDDAIWGALAGLGAASTAGGAATNYGGGFARAVAFLLVGVAGYLLGSNTVMDFFGDETKVPVTGAPAATAPAGSAVKELPRSTPPPSAAVPGSTSVTSTSAAAAPGTLAASEAPRVVYKEKVVYRDRPAGSNNSVSNDLQSNRSGSENGNEGNEMLSQKNILPPSHEAPRSTDQSRVNDGPTPPAEAPNMNGKSTSPAAQSMDSGRSAPHATNGPVDPSLALHGSDGTVPMDNPRGSRSSLWNNGLEISYGEYLGILSGAIVADDPTKNDPHYYSRHFDLTYRLDDGRFGIGARLGYGTFSRVSLYRDYMVREGVDGEVNRIDPIYRVRVQPEKQALLEFLVNYRLPVTDNLGLGVEASWGQSQVHTEAGGSFIVHWLLTDHIGFQAAGGINKYWYSYVGEQRAQILQDGADGMSISDKAADSYTGTSFEARYGIFYHF